MTRINCIPVQELTDKHLVAEYKELPRIIRLAEAAYIRGDMDLPKEYTMGTGHVRFFYDKLWYCFSRYINLIGEMRRRGMKPDWKNFQPIINSFIAVPDEIDNDWEPSEKEMNINRMRIGQRLTEGLTDKQKVKFGYLIGKGKPVKQAYAIIKKSQRSSTG